MFCCLIVGTHASGMSNSTVPVDVVRVKPYVDSLFNSTRVPVREGNARHFLLLIVCKCFVLCSNT